MSGRESGRAAESDERVRDLRAALREAIDELTESRSFISVETRHYPTVWHLNEVIERLTSVYSDAACGFAWAWEGSDDDHLHVCRHPDEHPGRHVCRCRSWQPRDAKREAAQNVSPVRHLHVVTPPAQTGSPS